VPVHRMQQQHQRLQHPCHLSLAAPTSRSWQQVWHVTCAVQHCAVKVSCVLQRMCFKRYVSHMEFGSHRGSCTVACRLVLCGPQRVAPACRNIYTGNRHWAACSGWFLELAFPRVMFVELRQVT
jgi:hypothetical protein